MHCFVQNIPQLKPKQNQTEMIDDPIVLFLFLPYNGLSFF